MPDAADLASANIVVQARLRTIVEQAVATVWAALLGYNRENVDQWLTTVVPLVDAAQRKSVALTDSYIARALDRPPLGIDPSELVGAAVRGGTDPATVYTRPFITLWSALQDQIEYSDAVAQGLHRATSTAATDIQLSHLRTYTAIAEADDRIVGWERVPDATACQFCRLIAGRRYHSQTLQPVHPHCGCGVAPITESNRGDFSGRADSIGDMPEGVTVHEHGELGPVLAAPGQHFTSLADIT